MVIDLCGSKLDQHGSVPDQHGSGLDLHDCLFGTAMGLSNFALSLYSELILWFLAWGDLSAYEVIPTPRIGSLLSLMLWD